MGAAEYLKRYQEQQAGEEPATPVSQPAPAATGGAADYLQRYKAKQTQDKGMGDMAQEPPIEPETPEQGFNINIVSEGMKKGMADVAALPGYLVDGANWLMDQIPGLDMEKDPFGGSKMIREGWEKLLMYEKQTPKSETEKYAGKISEFLGGSIMMGPAMINRALGAQATWTEMKRQAVVEGTAAVGGGIGAQWQSDVFAEAWGEEYRAIGEMTGGMSGAMVALTLKNIAAKSGLAWEPLMRALKIRGLDDVRALANDYGGAFARNRGKQKIAEAIGDSPSASRNIDRSMELSDEIKDFKPSPSQASGSQGMMLMQQGVESKNVANINRAVKNELANQQAVYAYYRDAFPEAEIKEFTAKRTFKATSNKIRMELREIDKSSSLFAKSFERKPSEAIGSRLESLAREKMKVVKDAKDVKYDELYKAADEQGVVDNISDIRQLVKDIEADDQYFFDTVPSVYKKIQALINPSTPSPSGLIELPGPGVAKPKPTDDIGSFRKIHSLYRELSREYGRALKSDDGVKIHHLTGLKNTLDDKLAKFGDPAYGNFANHKSAVDSFYRNEYYNVFKQGLGAEILGVGRNKATPEGLIVGSNILKKSTSQGLDQFNKLYGDIPEAQILLRDGVLDVFSRKTVIQGKLSQGAMDTFMRDYKEVLDKMPATKALFSGAEDAMKAMATRQQKLNSRLKLFNTQSASRYAKLAGYEDLDSAVEYAINDKGAMRILLRSMKSQESKDGLATTFADHVMGQSDPWEFLAKNEDTLKPIFNQLKPGHYRNIRNVAEAMNILNRHKTAMRVNPTGKAKDQLQEMIGTSVPSAFAQVRWAALYGKTSMSYVGADMGSKYLFKLHQDNVERLIEDSLYEPDLAKLLSDITDLETVIPQKMLSRLGQWAIQRGIQSVPRTARTAAIALDQEQQPNTP